MIIKSIALKDFRNYPSLFLEFQSGVNILYGDNAQGKTNILEAIYLCATSKSHRTTKDKELINFSKEESHIRMILEKKGIDQKIDIHLKNNKKKGIAINGIPINKLNQLFGVVNVVLFSPEDLTIIKNGPSYRRKFINLELCQLNPLYYHYLVQYYQILKQRNNLLKQIYSNENEWKNMIEIFDQQLLEYGSKIINERQLFINQLNDIVEKIHKILTDNNEKLLISYEPNVISSDYKKKLKQSLQKDIKTKTTNYGPHKDDICFKINNIDVRKYGSQGQQRTCALSLKLAEIELVKMICNDEPILLLDDVLSELDTKRQRLLLYNISSIQTIITCTGVEDFIKRNIEINNIYEVKNNQINFKNKINLT